jgi:ubiquinol-cytochrome c reductase cytochrome b subunit
MPNVELNLGGYLLSLNLIVPAVVIPGIMFTLLGLYPWIEAWVTGDRNEHHILDRPRNAPVRTGLGVMALSFYFMLWISGGNDILATAFDLSINAITWTLRFALFIVPPIAFKITKRICIGLQRRDNEKLLHGYESGQILRLPHGEFIEIHQPISQEEKAVILSKLEYNALPAAVLEDANGVRNPGARLGNARAKLSAWYFADTAKLPTPAELEAASQHHQHELEGSGTQH